MRKTVATILVALTTFVIAPAAATAHGHDGDDDSPAKVHICHMPPGNPDNPQSIEVYAAAVPAHLAHGDKLGECDEPDDNPGTPGQPGTPGANGNTGATGAAGPAGAPGQTTTVVVTRVETIKPKTCVSRRSMRVKLPGRFKNGVKVRVTIGGTTVSRRVQDGRVAVSLVGRKCGVYAVVFRKKGVKEFKRLYTAGPNGNVSAYNVPQPRR